jgi:hypothetical protein
MSLIQKVDYDENGLKRNIVGKVKAVELDFDITLIDKYYIHNQITPSTTWAVTHNLNKRPSVAVVDSAGSLVRGSVNYVSDIQITIEFNYAFAGTAYLN